MTIFRDLMHWMTAHAAFTTAMLVISVVVLVASLWLVHYFLTTIPADYFMRQHKPLDQWRNAHPVLRWTLIIGKNLVGVLLILAGVIMFFTPGQGILTLLLGITLVDLPGKHALERRIISRPTVLGVVNKLRERAGRPALVVE